MESPLSFFFRMHWDHEPGRISWSAAVVEDPAAALWMFPGCCGWCCAHSRAPMSRFMERERGPAVGKEQVRPVFFSNDDKPGSQRPFALLDLCRDGGRA